MVKWWNDRKWRYFLEKQTIDWQDMHVYNRWWGWWRREGEVERRSADNRLRKWFANKKNKKIKRDEERRSLCTAGKKDKKRYKDENTRITTSLNEEENRKEKKKSEWNKLKGKCETKRRNKSKWRVTVCLPNKRIFGRSRSHSIKEDGIEWCENSVKKEESGDRTKKMMKWQKKVSNRVETKSDKKRHNEDGNLWLKNEIRQERKGDEKRSVCVCELNRVDRKGHKAPKALSSRLKGNYRATRTLRSKGSTRRTNEMKLIKAREMERRWVKSEDDGRRNE